MHQHMHARITCTHMHYMLALHPSITLHYIACMHTQLTVNGLLMVHNFNKRWPVKVLGKKKLMIYLIDLNFNEYIDQSINSELSVEDGEIHEKIYKSRDDTNISRPCHSGFYMILTYLGLVTQAST